MYNIQEEYNFRYQILTLNNKFSKFIHIYLLKFISLINYNRNRK